MKEVNNYRDLLAWQRAYALGLLVYQITKSFPPEELYGLTSQLRRGVVAVISPKDMGGAARWIIFGSLRLQGAAFMSSTRNCFLHPISRI